MQLKNRPFRERLVFAWNGISTTWKSESSFRTQTILALGSIIVWAFLRASAVWWGILVTIIFSIFGAELINTSIEHVVDHLHPERHRKIGLAKDCAAGAVLVLSLAAIIVFVIFILTQISIGDRWAPR